MLYDLCCGFHIHSWIYVFGPPFSCKILTFQSLMKYLRSKRDQFYWYLASFWLKMDSFLLVIVPFPMRISFQTFKRSIFELLIHDFQLKIYNFVSFQVYFQENLKFGEAKQYLSVANRHYSISVSKV